MRYMTDAIRRSLYICSCASVESRNWVALYWYCSYLTQLEKIPAAVARHRRFHGEWEVPDAPWSGAFALPAQLSHGGYEDRNAHDTGDGGGPAMDNRQWRGDGWDGWGSRGGSRDGGWDQGSWRDR